uniref:Uncharacterized protein n=1 Tax=Cajanus cajan TaxID=3821 RepID=A0A151T6J9_CAJCA|nr:hypothetical protein KK1_017233 [Cajanus cajan]KYP62744.1 hypothetical protein KK1_017292 [Cajanus cajan]
MVEQLSGTYQAKDTMLQRYFHTMSHQISSFDEFTTQETPYRLTYEADAMIPVEK